MEFKDYKEKQKYYKRLNSERGRWVFISREKGDIKGRTYRKKDEELAKLVKEQLDKNTNK